MKSKIIDKASVTSLPRGGGEHIKTAHDWGWDADAQGDIKVMSGSWEFWGLRGKLSPGLRIHLLVILSAPVVQEAIG